MARNPKTDPRISPLTGDRFPEARALDHADAYTPPVVTADQEIRARRMTITPRT